MFDLGEAHENKDITRKTPYLYIKSISRAKHTNKSVQTLNAARKSLVLTRVEQIKKSTRFSTAVFEWTGSDTLVLINCITVPMFNSLMSPYSKVRDKSNSSRL